MIYITYNVVVYFRIAIGYLFACFKFQQDFLFAERITLSTGVTVHPSAIECEIRNLIPAVHHCMLYGKDRPYLVMLLTFRVRWVKTELVRDLQKGRTDELTNGPADGWKDGLTGGRTD